MTPRDDRRAAVSSAVSALASKGTAAASNNRATCTADHFPPRGAGMPRSSRSQEPASGLFLRSTRHGSLHFWIDGINGIRQPSAPSIPRTDRSHHGRQTRSAPHPYPRYASCTLHLLRDCPRIWFPEWSCEHHLVRQQNLCWPNGAIVNEQVVVAYLRGNVQAAQSLKAAIDGALLLAAPTPEGKSN